MSSVSVTNSTCGTCPSAGNCRCLLVNYKGLKLDCGYRVDMLVADTV